VRAVSIIFMLVFSVVVTWIAWPLALSGFAGAYEATRRPSYVEAPGVLTESRLDEDGYWAVRYAYSVDGRRYESEPAYDAAPAFGEEAGEDAALAAAYPVGSAVTVHYDPRRPERAVLDREVRGSDALMWLISLSATTFIVMPWLALMSLLFWERRDIAVGACDVSRSPTGATHVRMPAMSPIHLGMALAIFVPFVSVFVVLIGSLVFSGGAISLTAVLVDLAIVLAIIVGVPLWRWRRREAGAHDLVFDGTSITLPAMHGRTQSLTRHRGEVSGLHVSEARRSRGATHYKVWLTFGASPDEQIAEYSGDWERAEALAKWLGEKLDRPVTLSQAPLNLKGGMSPLR